jgi:hypothetical protein
MVKNKTATVFGIFALLAMSVPAFAENELQNVMKTMGAAFKTVNMKIGDGKNNGAVIEALDSFIVAADAALAAKVDTKAFAALAKRVGPENAELKYKSLVQGLRVTSLELKSILKDLGKDTCALECKSLLQQFVDFREIGHLTFKDPAPQP